MLISKEISIQTEWKEYKHLTTRTEDQMKAWLAQQTEKELMFISYSYFSEGIGEV